ncbi:hypothetical protein [Methanotorris formicicus]|uniref:Uncharacterized protein n=1 Tax=Methanotorris formicicus Mc-S-70 TaxID=647171 RepID=H1KXP9_9EURY|nr:hypothetical protein [Methanotorris formicicus]EHP88122.1 hypothetical protein MetfoDRAFT_0572 [Methanotorris formicicus Mc-S-70]
MGISKENLNKIVENLKDIKDITKIRKTIGDLKRIKISKEAINKLIEKSYDLEKVKEIVKELRNVGVKSKTINKLIENGYDIVKFDKKFKTITNSDPKLMKKLAKYINNWDISRSNPLDDSAESQKLVKVFNAKGVKTKVGESEPISNFAVLKEGTTNGFGWKHITRDKRLKEFKNFYSKRGLHFSSDEQLKEQILKDIENALKYGKPKYINEGKGEYQILYNDIFVSINKDDSITTAYPKTR